MKSKKMEKVTHYILKFDFAFLQMKKSKILSVLIFAMFMLLPLMAMQASATVPPLGTEPTSLPAIEYLYGGAAENISASDWTIFINGIYDNSTYISYNWTTNTTQDLIIFDLSYSGLNAYGLQMIKALSIIGTPTLANFTRAFLNTQNDSSQIKGYSNIQALNGGAYPGFSWSVPKVKKPEYQYAFTVILAGIVVSTFVLYYIFNRKR